MILILCNYIGSTHKKLHYHLNYPNKFPCLDIFCFKVGIRFRNVQNNSIHKAFDHPRPCQSLFCFHSFQRYFFLWICQNLSISLMAKYKAFGDGRAHPKSDFGHLRHRQVHIVCPVDGTSLNGSYIFPIYYPIG